MTEAAGDELVDVLIHALQALKQQRHAEDEPLTREMETRA
jgi:hypothetical protein